MQTIVQGTFEELPEITKNEVKTGYEISSFVDIENRQAPVLDNVQIRNSRHSATTSNKTAFNAVRFDLGKLFKSPL